MLEKMAQSGNHSEGGEGRNRMSSAHLTTRLGTSTSHPESDGPAVYSSARHSDPTAKKPKVALL
jgi:hypothetical protein